MTKTSFHSFDLSSAAAVLWRVVKLRRRYVFTRDDRLRLRYVATGFAGLCVATVLSMGSLKTYTTGPAAALNAMEPSAGLSVGSLYKDASDFLGAYRDQNGQIRRSREAIESFAMAHEEDNSPLEAQSLEVEIDFGDTVASALKSAGLNGEESQQVANAIFEHVNPRSVKAGQKMDLRLVPDAAGRNLVFSNASFRVDNLKTVTVQKDGSGSLVTGMVEKEVKQKRAAANVVINDSLYASANRAGIPDRVVSNAIRLFSYSIDFQRDIKRGDRMEVLYDSFQTAEGDTVKTGDIIYARMILGGKEYPLYRYEGRDGSADYYTPEGKSLKRSATLMKTPIDGARMSSGFGVRRHPVLGYTKMHKGVDFAAPTGTPIYAAGNGTIERAGRFSSYGNYVRIRHNAKLSTAYAHVSRYASGIRPGVKVKQGQVIAYVGTTGRSTGPHLHFEVMVNGVQVNPRNLKLPESNALQGEELRRFKNSIRNFDQQYVELTSAVKLASAE